MADLDKLSKLEKLVFKEVLDCNDSLSDYTLDVFFEAAKFLSGAGLEDDEITTLLADIKAAVEDYSGEI